MMYSINGKRVSREEFFNNAKGFDYSKPFRGSVGGFTPFVSPIDGKEIANSKQLAAHNREHNVQQVGNEFKQKRESRRE